MKNRIIELCKMPEKELFFYVEAILQHYYDTEIIKDKYENYIFVQGEDPVCLVAHMDTVFSQPSEKYYFDQEQGVVWSPTGMGADDRAGILMIILALEGGFRPSIILTTGEEIGGVGASLLVTDYKTCPLENIKYFIELDRANEKDCVFYSCNNKKFKTYIENFGFNTASGTFTDISVFMPQWNIAGVNLSIGYNNEHSYGEYLNINYFMETFKKLRFMLIKSKEAPYFRYIPKKVFKFSMKNSCAGCGASFKKNEKKYCFKDKQTEERFFYCEACANYIKAFNYN